MDRAKLKAILMAQVKMSWGNKTPGKTQVKQKGNKWEIIVFPSRLRW